jgi:hypothetical protein
VRTGPTVVVGRQTKSQLDAQFVQQPLNIGIQIVAMAHEESFATHVQGRQPINVRGHCTSQLVEQASRAPTHRRADGVTHLSTLIRNASTEARQPEGRSVGSQDMGDGSISGRE